ncbi:MULTISPECIES: hypothetical protein [Acinetobacter]|uniref:Uncharacterized protein n=1 Tax=Acinetobacter corruptisaponis TaxID=3045147 RepID=A0ABY8S282_9GAMM|nr:hypothetical protein [Acinetobacter sp. KCTC 92772]WHP05805.1 hypothetical protein QLH32_17660 [Acinetobacter sp. KCTC 92772]
MNPIIRGDTWNLTLEYRDRCNRLIDLTDTEVTASVELPDQTWSQNINVVVLDQAINKGKALISADTESWRVGEMRLKVTRTKFGVKKSSIAKIKVIEG